MKISNLNRRRIKNEIFDHGRYRINKLVYCSECKHYNKTDIEWCTKAMGVNNGGNYLYPPAIEKEKPAQMNRDNMCVYYESEIFTEGL